MNKNLNTAIFAVAGTLFSIVVTGLIFFGLLAFIVIAFGKVMSPGLFAGLTMAAFTVAIVASFFVYRVVITMLVDKFKLQDHITDSFLPQKKPRA